MYEKFRPKKFHLNGNQDSPEGPATGKIATYWPWKCQLLTQNNIILRQQ